MKVCMTLYKSLRTDKRHCVCVCARAACVYITIIIQFDSLSKIVTVILLLLCPL